MSAGRWVVLGLLRVLGRRLGSSRFAVNPPPRMRPSLLLDNHQLRHRHLRTQRPHLLPLDVQKSHSIRSRIMAGRDPPLDPFLLVPHVHTLHPSQPGISPFSPPFFDVYFRYSQNICLVNESGEGIPPHGSLPPGRFLTLSTLHLLETPCVDQSPHLLPADEKYEVASGSDKGQVKTLQRPPLMPN